MGSRKTTISNTPLSQYATALQRISADLEKLIGSWDFLEPQARRAWYKITKDDYDRLINESREPVYQFEQQILRVLGPYALSLIKSNAGLSEDYERKTARMIEHAEGLSNAEEEKHNGED